MLGQHWSETEVADLARMYPDPSFSLEELERHFRRSRGTIKAKARLLKIRREALRPWTEAEEQLLRDLYPDLNTSREEIARRLGRTWRAIQHRIGQLGIKDTRQRNNPCQVRRDYFKVIDSDEKAYWLGFIAADGVVYIGGRQHTVRIDLQPRDRHWIERFRDIIAPGMQITKHGDRSYSFGIGSQELVHDLIAIGITPRKSLTLEWPQVPDPFVMPFLCGYFDGDGCLHRRQGRRKELYQWSLLGTLPFLTVAREHIQKAADVELKLPIRANKRASPHLHLLYAGGGRVLAIDRALKACGLGLPRKHIAATQTAP
jgi:hypothetical protein